MKTATLSRTCLYCVENGQCWEHDDNASGKGQKRRHLLEHDGTTPSRPGSTNQGWENRANIFLRKAGNIKAVPEQGGMTHPWGKICRTFRESRESGGGVRMGEGEGSGWGVPGGGGR
jgi:hypothetical protein